jgi:hypothetical protein
MHTSWTWIPLPHHVAVVDEIMQVLWSEHYGAALFGDDGEVAWLPYRGCRLEVVSTAETSHEKVNLLLPGQTILYRGRSWFLHRFQLPGRTTVGLWHLVDFRLRLASDTVRWIPSEDAILDRVRGGPERVTAGCQ